MNRDGVGVHATAVLLGDIGLMIEGRSGSGKSWLAAALLELARAAGLPAFLVGDDRVLLDAEAGRLVGRPHAALAGRLELRGVGIVTVPFVPAAALQAVVRLDAGPDELAPRLPDGVPTVDRCGIALPCLSLPAGLGTADQALRLRVALPFMLPGDRGGNQLANSFAMHKIAPHCGGRAIAGRE